LLSLFPFAHEVRVQASVGRGELTLTTTVAAAPDDPRQVSLGYHPYARVPGVDRDAWRVTLGASNRLALDERGIPTGERAPIDRTPFVVDGASLDDAFDAPSTPATFAAAAGGATLSVEFLSGYPYAQVFAPAGQQFICFEPMTAPTNALNSGDGLTVLAPGESHRAEFRISLAR
jgi:galactose mutarotase-like enzyme